MAQGREYRYGNVMLTLYPISYVAKSLEEALGEPRTTQTIRKWEKQGIIPPAIFRAGGHRMYHQAQIDVIALSAKEAGIRQGVPLSETDFSVRVWEGLSEVNAKLKKAIKDSQK